jgi:prepilin-type N-terminal cleavage/methylation domain-containing protein
MAKIKHFLKKSAKKLRNNKGFSLTEIMITMSIVGSVSTFACAQMNNVLPVTRDAQRKANIHQVQIALNLYYDDYGQYPVSIGNEPSQEGWQMIEQALTSPDNTYMPELPQDPLNQNLNVFKYWSDGQKFKISYETEDQGDQSPQIAWGM